MDVVLVNEQDIAQGTMEKLAAHRDGALHRAISVFLFNDKGELLLQQRALGKYHSGGLWSNTCCSHPYDGELPEEAASRRLMEEMGIATQLSFLFSFRYNEDVGGGMIENEYDHVFTGIYNKPADPNPDEVMAYRYISYAALQEEIVSHPQNFTVWFRMVLDQVMKIHRLMDV